jgi:hypothetical protein
MLVRPIVDESLDPIQAMLASWDLDADGFRIAASAARRGEQPSSATLKAAEEAHDGLIGLLEEIDRILEALPPGHPNFSPLLRAQIKAVALMESVGTSLDVLERFVTDPVAEPVHIGHDLRIAAE